MPILARVMLSAALLGGCSADAPPAPEPPLHPSRPDPTDRLSLAGIDSPARARAFLARMRGAALREDREALGGMVRHPFTTYDRGTPAHTYRDQAALLAAFDRIFTPAVLRAMAAARYDDLFVNSRGAMIGEGEVWFDQGDGGIRIKAINGAAR